MIGIMGNDFFGKRMVNSLSKKIPVVFFYTSLKDIRFQKKIKDVKIVHYIGSPTVSLHGVFTIIRLKISGKKIIMHWIGADSWMAQNLFFPKIFTRLFKNQASLHLAVEKGVLDRIEKLGISATLYSLPVASHYELEPLPDKKQVIAYVPDMTEYYWERFNGDIIKKIVKEFNDVHFIIVRNSGKRFDEPNVECHEWIDDMKEIYKKTIAIIRISTHDGHPGVIREALSMGRHVIYSEEVPFCKKATNFDELKVALTEILTEPKLNVEGSKFINDEFSLDKMSTGLVEIYKTV